jgi:hypothetical protein
MITIYPLPPEIKQYFSRSLFSYPMPGFKVEQLKDLADFLLRKISNPKYNKYPKTQQELILKHLELMELYGRAKAKEIENKDKTNIRTQLPFYRPKFPDIYFNGIYEGLKSKYRTSRNMRKNHEVSKI